MEVKAYLPSHRGRFRTTQNQVSQLFRLANCALFIALILAFFTPICMSDTSNPGTDLPCLPPVGDLANSRFHFQ